MSGRSPKIINPPTQLADKVSSGFGGVDLAALERAESLIANMQGNYLEWVEEDFARLQEAYDSAMEAANAGQDLNESFEKIFGISHDMKGQGGSFNYDLMTIVGNQLCRFIEKLDTPKKGDLAIVKVHMDAMRLIISKRMEGDGGKAGDNLVRGLEAVMTKRLG